MSIRFVLVDAANLFRYNVIPVFRYTDTGRRTDNNDNNVIPTARIVIIDKNRSYRSIHLPDFNPFEIEFQDFVVGFAEFRHTCHSPLADADTVPCPFAAEHESVSAFRYSEIIGPDHRKTYKFAEFVDRNLFSVNDNGINARLSAHCFNRFCRFYAQFFREIG